MLNVKMSWTVHHVSKIDKVMLDFYKKNKNCVRVDKNQLQIECFYKIMKSLLCVSTTEKRFISKLKTNLNNNLHNLQE